MPSATVVMILELTSIRSSRLMPGLRGTPAVMMMMSEFALKENKSYNLKMKVPSSLERKEQKEAGGYIEFTATCKWTKNDDADRDFFLSGFEFTSVSEEAHAIIHRVIEEYRLP